MRRGNVLEFEVSDVPAKRLQVSAPMATAKADWLRLNQIEKEVAIRELRV